MEIERCVGRRLRFAVAIGLGALLAGALGQVGCSSASSTLPNGGVPDSGRPTTGLAGAGGASGAGGAVDAGGPPAPDGASGGAGGSGGTGGFGGFGGTSGFGGAPGTDGGIPVCGANVMNGGSCSGQQSCSLGAQTCTCRFASGSRRWSCR